MYMCVRTSDKHVCMYVYLSAAPLEQGRAAAV